MVPTRIARTEWEGRGGILILKKYGVEKHFKLDFMLLKYSDNTETAQYLKCVSLWFRIPLAQNSRFIH